MVTYFISDLHLHANSQQQSALLLDFIQNKAYSADAVYILGDLFAIWLGDDLNEPYSAQLAAALKQLSKTVPVYFMPGNRDFLVGQKFCLSSGCNLLPDPFKIDLYGQQVLLTHGDMLCTLDLRYQKFRKIVQNSILNAIFLKLPIAWRKKLGKFIQSKSQRAVKNPQVYDVSEDSVKTWFAAHNVNLIIHGHTHRPAIHQYNNQHRIVLGDWTAKSAQILRYNANGFELVDLIV